MVKDQPAYYVLVICVVIFCQPPIANADGLLWINTTNTLVNVQLGSSINLTWHYETKNSTFLSSELHSGKKSDAFASRYQGEDNYELYDKNQTKISSILGKNNIILTIFIGDLSSGNCTYCCRVIWKTKSGKHNDERCTTVFAYDIPRITYLSPQLFSRQGDTVKLVCNSTGYPEPIVRWIHRDTNDVSANSSELSLKVTGKTSEGRYCCEVKNEFGKDAACTVVNVTEYAPVKTEMFPNSKHGTPNESLEINCNAIASPPPTHYCMWEKNKEQYNSTNGKQYFKVMGGTRSLTISCIPWNKYGRGPKAEISLPVYEPPSFTSEQRTRYNMTNRTGINITCPATGFPTPNFTWTEGGTGEIIGTKENYEVLYVKCATKTLTFYCYASNILGRINSTDIQVQMMVDHGNSNCNQDGQTVLSARKVIVIIVVVSAIFLVLVNWPVGLICYFWKLIVGQHQRRHENNPSHKPDETANGNATHEERIPLTVNPSHESVEVANGNATHEERIPLTVNPSHESDEIANGNAVHEERIPLTGSNDHKERLQVTPAQADRLTGTFKGLTQSDDKEEGQDMFTEVQIPADLGKTESQKGLKTYDPYGYRGVNSKL